MRTATFHTHLTIAKSNAGQFYTSAAKEDELKSLRQLLPNQEDIQDDNDLVHFVGNAACVGIVNLNNIGILPQSAINSLSSYINKPVNAFHDRSRNIGFIKSTALSSFPDNQLITAEEALSANKPFNIVITGLAWKIVDDGYIADAIEHYDNPNNPDENLTLSISWELSFTDFVIAKGTKNLFKAEIIADAEGIEKYSKYLREEGGSGMTDEAEEVYMVISGNPICRGIGIVTNPAGNVRGVATHKTIATQEVAYIKAPDPSPEFLSKIEESVKKAVASIEEEKNIKKSEKSLSQAENLNVNKPQLMKSFHNKEEVQTFLTEASIDVETQKGLFLFLENAYKAEADKYQAEKSSAKELAELASAQTKAEQEKVAKLEQTVQDLVAQLNESIAASEQAQKEALFEKRFNALAEEFDLSGEKTSSFVSRQIKDLSEADFKTWYEEVASLLPVKSQPVVTPAEAAKAVQDSKASTETIPNSQEIEAPAKYGNLKGFNTFTLQKI